MEEKIMSDVENEIVENEVAESEGVENQVVENKTPLDLPAAFRIVKEQKGEDVLRNDEALAAAFAETAPGLKREKRLVEVFAAAGGAAAFAEKGVNAKEAVVKTMNEEYWIDERAASWICEEYLTVSGIRAEEDNSLLAQADRYYRGDGVPLDKEKAAELYTAAADEGDVVAQYTIGYMLDKGDGVEKDRDAAMAWYEKAAEQGYESAINRLIILKKAKENPPVKEKKKGFFGF